MGQTHELSERKPPRALERSIAFLLPRACQEHVLGDLQERYTSPVGYLADAATVVPAIVWGRLWKAKPLPYFFLETALVFAGVFFAGVRTPSDGPASFVKSAALTAFLALALLFRDAYAGVLPHQSRGRALDLVEAEVRGYLTVYFSLAVLWFSQDIFPSAPIMLTRDSVFPGIMTTLKATWMVGGLLTAPRIWLAKRERRLHEAP
jgi:hypothetical protein